MPTQMRKILVYGLALLMPAMMALSACSTTASEPASMALPELSYAHVVQIPVNVGQVDVVNNYKPGADLRDVSGSFPTPPDMALQNYANNRFKPMGGQDILKIVIDDSHIFHDEEKARGALRRWMGIDSKDIYMAEMKVRVFTISPSGGHSQQVTMTFTGKLEVPESYSIADREAKQLQFVEILMGKVDHAFIDTLQNKLHLIPADYQAVPLSMGMDVEGAGAEQAANASAMQAADSDMGMTAKPREEISTVPLDNAGAVRGTTNSADTTTAGTAADITADPNAAYNPYRRPMPNDSVYPTSTDSAQTAPASLAPPAQ